jgi:hypothetical protein
MGRPLNVLGIGPSHKTRRSLNAYQTWACSRIAAITKWACAASEVVDGEVVVLGKGGSMKRGHTKGSRLFQTRANWGLSSTNQSDPSRPHIQGVLLASKALGQMPLVHTSEAKRRVMEEIENSCYARRQDSCFVARAADAHLSPGLLRPLGLCSLIHETLNTRA